MSRRSELLRLARRLGWRLDGLTGGGHVRLTKPARPFVIVAATPSDRRWQRNALAQLRRADRADPHPVSESSP